MNPEILKLLPLLGVIVSSHLLWSYSRPSIPRIEHGEKANLGRVQKTAEYHVPAGLADPFVFSPGGGPAQEARPQARTRRSPSMRLDGIMLGPGRALASINGRLLAPGDVLGDMRVEDILPDRVVLVRGRERLVKTLPPPAHGGRP